MKQLNQFKAATAGVVFFCFAVGCNQSTADETANKTSEVGQSSKTETDPAKLKAEIQEQEAAWAVADNARDVTAMAAFYSDDAISMENNKPMLVGNAAIKQSLEASIAKRPKGHTVSYEVMEVYGDDDRATEIGKTTRKDSTGNVTSTGKYMAIWEKRNGKWICIRDIGNDDAERK